MSSAAVYCSSIAASSAPVQEQPNPAIDWHLLDSQMIRQGMERLTPHKASSRSSDTNPYIHLIRAYLRALVPQAQSHDDNHISKAVGMLSAQVVTAFLDMWLTDLDMLTPTTAAKQPSASRGSPLSRSQSPTPHDPPPTSARVPTFSTPTILHSSSIKVCIAHAACARSYPAVYTSVILCTMSCFSRHNESIAGVPGDQALHLAATMYALIPA